MILLILSGYIHTHDYANVVVDVVILAVVEMEQAICIGLNLVVDRLRIMVEFPSLMQHK